MLTIKMPAYGELIDGLGREIERRRPELLNLLGVQLLSLARANYVVLSRGGTGVDGTRWKELERGTLEARVRSRAPAKRIVAKRKKLAEQIEATKGRGSGKAIAALRKKRQELEDDLQAMVDEEFASHQIGVDHGLQLNSMSPGFMGSDNQGGNIFEVETSQVTIGAHRIYSEYFDELRPIIPDPVPAEWQTKLEKTASDWGAEIVYNAF